MFSQVKDLSLEQTSGIKIRAVWPKILGAGKTFPCPLELLTTTRLC